MAGAPCFLARARPRPAATAVVVVAPHPDDEVLGVGGLLRLLGRPRAEVVVVAVTDGEASHPGSPDPHARPTWPSPGSRERADALRLLGVDARPRASGSACRTATSPRPRPSSSRRCATCCARPTGASRPGAATAIRTTRRPAALPRRPRDRGRAPDCSKYPIWTWHWAEPDDARVPWDRARRVRLPPAARPAQAAAAAELRQPDRAAVRRTRPTPPSCRRTVLAPAARAVRDGVRVTLRRRLLRPDVRGLRGPWGFADRWYEQRKYALTVASLPRPRYRRAFEIGCSVGVLTALLGERCGELLAVDVAAAAVASRPSAARRTSAGHVEHARGARGLAGRAVRPGRALRGRLLLRPATTSPSASTGVRRARTGRRTCWRCTGGIRSPTTRWAATRCTRPRRRAAAGPDRPARGGRLPARGLRTGRQRRARWRRRPGSHEGVASADRTGRRRRPGARRAGLARRLPARALASPPRGVTCRSTSSSSPTRARDATAEAARAAGVRVVEIGARNVGGARAAGWSLLAPEPAAPGAGWRRPMPTPWYRRDWLRADGGAMPTRAGTPSRVGVQLPDWAAAGRRRTSRRAWQADYAGEPAPVHGANLGVRAVALRTPSAACRRANSPRTPAW